VCHHVSIVPVLDTGCLTKIRRYALRRCASRLLTTRTSSLITPSRTYTSFSTPSSRLAQRSPAFQLQRRWATTEAEEKPLDVQKPEIVHEATSEAVPEVQETAAEVQEAQPEAEQAPPVVAETANATEVTEESLPAAETGEQLSAGGNADQFPGANSRLGSVFFEKKPSLYVGNLFFDVTETDLVREFARFGTVNKVKIVRDPRGLSKGYVFPILR
jgi:nucleolin